MILSDQPSRPADAVQSRPDMPDAGGRQSRIGFTLAESARLMPVIASPFARKSALCAGQIP